MPLPRGTTGPRDLRRTGRPGIRQGWRHRESARRASPGGGGEIAGHRRRSGVPDRWPRGHRRGDAPAGRGPPGRTGRPAVPARRRGMVPGLDWPKRPRPVLEHRMWLWHLRSLQALTHGNPAGAGPSILSTSVRFGRDGFRVRASCVPVSTLRRDPARCTGLAAVSDFS